MMYLMVLFPVTFSDP